jgi:hypothetical protein
VRQRVLHIDNYGRTESTDTQICIIRNNEQLRLWSETPPVQQNSRDTRRGYTRFIIPVSECATRSRIYVEVPSRGRYFSPPRQLLAAFSRATRKQLPKWQPQFWESGNALRSTLKVTTSQLLPSALLTSSESLPLRSGSKRRARIPRIHEEDSSSNQSSLHLRSRAIVDNCDPHGNQINAKNSPSRPKRNLRNNNTLSSPSKNDTHLKPTKSLDSMYLNRAIVPFAT